MTRYQFMERIGFFMVGKKGDVWQGRMLKKQQVETFGFYLGRGLLVVNQLTMTITHFVSINYGSEKEQNKVLSTCGFSDNSGNFTKLVDLPIN